MQASHRSLFIGVAGICGIALFGIVGFIASCLALGFAYLTLRVLRSVVPSAYPREKSLFLGFRYLSSLCRVLGLLAVISATCALGAFVVSVSLCEGGIACSRGFAPSLAHDPEFWSEHHPGYLLPHRDGRTVIATAASHQYFENLQNFVGSVHFWEPDMTIVVWDIGMDAQQLAQVACWRNVELQYFQFSNRSEHVARLETYAWKPIITKLTLQSHEAVIWLDSEVELRGPLHGVLNTMARQGYWFAQESGTVEQHTYLETYRQLNVRQESFLGLPFCSGNGYGFVRGSAAYLDVLLTAVTCANTEACIAPKKSTIDATNPYILGHHNFDHSVFSILAYSKQLICNSDRALHELDHSRATLDETTFNNVVILKRGQYFPLPYRKHLAVLSCTSSERLSQHMKLKNNDTRPIIQQTHVLVHCTDPSDMRSCARAREVAANYPILVLLVWYNKVFAFAGFEAARALSCWLFHWIVASFFVAALTIFIWGSEDFTINIAYAPFLFLLRVFHPRSFVKLYHKYARQVIAVSIIIVFAFILAVPLLRRAQTGSMFWHEYDWYNPGRVGQRLHPDVAPRNHSTDCQFRQISSSAISKPECRQKGNATMVVHVLAEHSAFLPWIWHSVLSGDDDEHLNPTFIAARHGYQDVDGLLNLEPQQKRFSRSGIRFVLEPYPLKPERAKLIDNVLLIEEYFKHPSTLALLRPDTRVGLLVHGSESCNLAKDSRFLDERIGFGFVTYGDCTLVDGQKWQVWPIGPTKTVAGFPSRLDPRSTPSIASRLYDLNMMMTYTADKPSRIQAWMAVDPFCSTSLSCVIESGDFLVARVHEVFDSYLGLPFSGQEAMIQASEHYQSVLRSSKLTLCPSGKNPEQHRIWEAIMSGSIPVIEDPSDAMVPGEFIHPAYGNDWRCQPEDIHRLLKETGAPVIWVKDWRADMARLVSELSDEALSIRQKALASWYAGFLEGLRDRLLCQIVALR